MAKKTVTKKPSATKKAPAAKKTTKAKAEENENEEDKIEDQDDEQEDTPAASGDEDQPQDKAEDQEDSDDEEEPSAEDDEEDEDEAPAPPSVAKRIARIMDAPEASGQSNLARHLALKTGLSSNMSIAVLKAAQADKAAKTGSLRAAMAGLDYPKLAGGAGQPAKNALVDNMKSRFSKK
jgi:hypothetical protein